MYSTVSSRAAVAVLASFVGASLALAQTPAEVTGLRISEAENLTWNSTINAQDYNIYRGLLDQLIAGTPPRCHANEIAVTQFVSPDDPPVGSAYVYLVTAEGATGLEGTPGTSSAASTRALLGRCDPVERTQLLNRVTYGFSEYAKSRYDALGWNAFIDEQLAPASIDESSNTDLTTRRAPLIPPENTNELVGLAIVNGTYARRQLEQVVTIFWVNHFNTNYNDIRGYFNRPDFTDAVTNQLTAETQYRETEQFRSLAFTGTFREIVEASAKSPAMILYLDNDENVVGKPNENYARELLELHTMGVDNGYTQLDIEELARALTGWNVCKKTDANKGDPLAACISRVLEGTTAGTYVSNFRIAQHDHGQKILFQGTPHQVTLPSTQSNQSAGVNDLQSALDAIAGHPSTRQFIAQKLLQWFVQELPSASQVAAVEAVWLAQAGDLREVLRAVLLRPELRNPDAFRQKVRTPLEQVLAAFRATRGKTNGFTTVRAYLQRMQQLPHQNPVPTGYSELGADWIDTNNTLERQNFGMDVTALTGTNFGTDLTGLMSANGLTTASTPESIVDFWSDVLFGGALTPADRQEAIDYLKTNDSGVLDPVLTNARLREVVGFMLGYPIYQEQ